MTSAGSRQTQCASSDLTDGFHDSYQASGVQLSFVPGLDGIISHLLPSAETMTAGNLISCAMLLPAILCPDDVGAKR
jgi:hypothetical protein